MTDMLLVSDFWSRGRVAGADVLVLMNGQKLRGQERT
jgi:hypothetical protein